MKLILFGMVLMLVMQWIGLMFFRFEKLAVDLMELGVRFMPISVIALIATIILEIFWRGKDENNK